MDPLKTVELPKALKKATGSKMKFSIGETYTFDEEFKQKSGLLYKMPSVHEHVSEEVDNSAPRLM